MERLSTTLMRKKVVKGKHLLEVPRRHETEISDTAPPDDALRPNGRRLGIASGGNACAIGERIRIDGLIVRRVHRNDRRHLWSLKQEGRIVVQQS